MVKLNELRRLAFNCGILAQKMNRKQIEDAYKAQRSQQKPGLAGSGYVDQHDVRLMSALGMLDEPGQAQADEP